MQGYEDRRSVVDMDSHSLAALILSPAAGMWVPVTTRHLAMVFLQQRQGEVIQDRGNRVVVSWTVTEVTWLSWERRAGVCLQSTSFYIVG